MTDCVNADIRDQLPDFVAGILSATETDVVERHVSTCVACTQEVALLEAVRAVRPRAISVDVASIVARLPRTATGAASPALTLVPRTPAATNAVANGKARSTPRSRMFSTWRVAAAITIIAAGGLSVAIARSGLMATANSVASGDSVVPGITIAVADSPALRGNGAAVARIPTTSGNASSRAALSVGELSEFSDDELESLIKSLEAWDGAASADPVPTVPIVRTSGGTQ